MSRVSLFAAAAFIFVMFVGSTVPTPLYAIYARTVGFSEAVLTLIFSGYVVGTLASLFLLGRLSDQAGRRPVALLAIGIAALSAIAFLLAHTTAMLFVARVLTGIAVALGSGTGTAWIVELYHSEDRQRATVVSTVANLIGLAFGPLVAGVLAAYTKAPTTLPFVVYLGLLIAAGIAVWGSCETVKHPSRVVVRPRLGVPRELWSQFALPATIAFVTMAVSGFYFALLPSMLTRTLHLANPALGGAIVAEFSVGATIAVVATRALSSRWCALAGVSLFLPALGVLVAAERDRSLAMLIAAAALGGVAMGLAYRGSLQLVNEMAPSDRRAEMVSSYMVACFAGLALPTIGTGVLSQRVDPVLADEIFAIAMAALAALAITTLLSRGLADRRHHARPASAAR